MSLLGAGIIIGASLGLLFGTRAGAQVRRTVRRAARNAVGSPAPRPGEHIADARDSAYGASDYGVRVPPVKA